MAFQQKAHGYTSLHSTPRTSFEVAQPTDRISASTSSATTRPSFTSKQSSDSVAYRVKRAFATHDENGQPKMNTYDAMMKPDGNCSIQ